MLGELPIEKLRNFYDAKNLPCKTTEDISPLDNIIGQERALKSLHFGLEIGEQGFNIYAAGQPGTGKTTTVNRFIEDLAIKRASPSDWCYVYNFKSAQEPNAIELPHGRAVEFKDDMSEFLGNVKKVLPEVFQSEDYITRRESMQKEAQESRNKLFTQLNEIAQEKGFALQSSESGLLVVPVIEGQPISEKELRELDSEDVKIITKASIVIEAKRVLKKHHSQSTIRLV